MESLAEILEDELKEAVEVKNPKSLHRYILLLSENLIQKKQHQTDIDGIRSDITEVIAVMRERFAAVDKRFEDMQNQMDKRFEGVDKRFEDMQRYMDRRFSSMQRFMGLGFTVLAVLFTVFQYI